MSLDEVRSLVAERQRFDEWIQSLETRRAETPARVFDRVLADYSSRRAIVQDKLRGHVDAVSSVGEGLEARIAALDERLTGHEDERAEAMLRASVGEYDDSRWEVMRREVESSILKLTEERTALLSESTEIRALLASARPDAMPSTGGTSVPGVSARARDEMPTAPAGFNWSRGTPATGAPTLPPAAEAAPAAPAAPLVPAVRAAPAVAAVAAVAAVSAATTVAPAAADSETAKKVEVPKAKPQASEPTLPVVTMLEHSSDELLVAGAVYRHTEGTLVRVPNSKREEELAASRESELDDALALFSSQPHGVEAHSPPEGRTAPDRIDPYHRGSGAGFHPLSDTPVGMPSVASPTPAFLARPSSAEAAVEPKRAGFDDLAFLRSVIDPSAQTGSTRSGAANDQQKTLRCTECGTMNFPTEWYCERCGGELAAF